MNKHKQVPLQIKNETVQVDRGVTDLIRRINESPDLRTMYSCQNSVSTESPEYGYGYVVIIAQARVLANWEEKLKRTLSEIWGELPVVYSPRTQYEAPGRGKSASVKRFLAAVALEQELRSNRVPGYIVRDFAELTPMKNWPRLVIHWRPSRYRDVVGAFTLLNA